MWHINRCKRYSSVSSPGGAPQSGLRECLQRLQRDESGSLLIFGLVLLIVMLITTGMGIDVIRSEITRTRIQNTMDRAVLAATDTSNAVEPKVLVNDYFDKAGLGHYMSDEQINVQETGSGGTVSYRGVSATSKAQVNTYFMRMVGVDTLSAVAAAAAEEGVTNAEVSLVLDVSGSMTKGQKLNTLKKAAKDFIYFMQCDPRDINGRPGDLSAYNPARCKVPANSAPISIIPYAEQVVLGPRIFEDTEVTNEHNESYCVTFDAADFTSASITMDDSNNQLKRVLHFREQPKDKQGIREKWVCRNDEWRKVRPFLSSYDKAAPYIDDLEAGGGTSIDIGVKWGTALLHEDFVHTTRKLAQTSDAGSPPIVSNAMSERPVLLSDLRVIKTLVLMTDGTNYYERKIKSQYRSGPSYVWTNTEYVNKDPSEFAENDPRRKMAEYRGISVYHPGRNEYFYPHDLSWHSEPFGDRMIPEVVELCSNHPLLGTVCHDVATGNTINEPGEAKNVSYPMLWSGRLTASDELDAYDTFSEYLKLDDKSGERWLEDPIEVIDAGTKNNRTLAICNAAKNAGITVFTIGFEVTSGHDVLKKCATTEGHFFYAKESNLSEIFFQIAGTIDTLRLTQ